MSENERRTVTWPTIVVAILCSIVASLLYDKFIPTITWIYVTFSYVMNFFYKGYIDSQYKRASFHPEYDTIATILLNVYLIPLSIILREIVGLYSRGQFTKKEGYTHLFLIPFFPFCDGFRFLHCYLRRYHRFLKLLCRGGCKAQLRKELASLSPAVTDEERNLFTKRWTLMKSKADYDNIMVDLKKLGR